MEMEAKEMENRYVDYFVFGLLIVLAASLSYFLAIRKCKEIVNNSRLEMKTVDVQKVMSRVQEVCQNNQNVSSCIKENLERVDKRIKELDDGRSLILIKRAVLSDSNVQDVTGDVLQVVK
ncbi:hypothetical protein [Desulfurobacterium sp. TC5-1]|uniref:hypothetical protein n=1 Tax=Desulfurobacterium sp. TC5-1 TaxID=1158318 RepID=UPI0003B44F37|nr:hypothetical protein [Desulfurobacterium sp. TC5-1]